MKLGLILSALLCGPALAGPVFDPVPVPNHVYAGRWEHFVGGGLAAFDCDGDHLPDLFAAGGSNPATLLRNRSEPGGDISFVADTPPSLALTGVTGAYPLDIDSDGHLDLALLRVGENQLLRGGPDCSFTPFDIGFDSADRWTTSFSATWEQGQTLPTLAFGNYVNRSDPAGPFRACDDHALYRPSAASRYAPPVMLSPGFCTLSMLFSDWGRHGRADLRISNDRHYYVSGGEEQLWAMTRPPRLYTAQDGWQSFRLWGMGIASRDLDFDGLPEIYLTSMGDQRLQALTDGAATPRFADVPYERGTTAHRPYQGGDGRPSTGWHVAFGDVQNDGLDDIFVTKGNVEQMPDSAMDDPNSLLIQTPSATFAEAGGTGGLASMHRGRGAALIDLNRDGLLDVAVVNRRALLEVYRNRTASPGHWLSLHLSQPAPNVHAIGAWIEVETETRTYSREITVGGGHAGGQAGPEHFGLGTAGKIRLRVIWPDGTGSDWVETSPNLHLRVTRSGTALTLTPY